VKRTPCRWCGWSGRKKHVLCIVDAQALEPVRRGVHADGGVDDVSVGAGVDEGTGGEAVRPEVGAARADGPGVEILEGLGGD